MDIVLKPKLGIVDGLPRLMGDLSDRVKAAARVDVRHFGRPQTTDRRPRCEASDIQHPTSNLQFPISALPETTDRVIAIGASAGGVAALGHVIPAFPAASPGIVIVQRQKPSDVRLV